MSNEVFQAEWHLQVIVIYTVYRLYIKIFRVCLSACPSVCHLTFFCCCTSGHSELQHYEKYAIVDACHRTSDGQEHRIKHAGPERDTILNLRVTEGEVVTVTTSD